MPPSTMRSPAPPPSPPQSGAATAHVKPLLGAGPQPVLVESQHVRAQPPAGRPGTPDASATASGPCACSAGHRAEPRSSRYIARLQPAPQQRGTAYHRCGLSMGPGRRRTRSPPGEQCEQPSRQGSASARPPRAGCGSPRRPARGAPVPAGNRRSRCCRRRATPSSAAFQLLPTLLLSSLP
jgi:hypothetical protein